MEIQKKEIIVKPKRQKIDDSKNGDYFTFCRNKKCNQPLYKNRSNMDTRYCMECLQKGNMKEYIIIGRVFSEKHGYLATRQKAEIKATDKIQALKLAKQQMKSCNDFEIVEEEDLEHNPHIAQMEKDYYEQEERISDDPQIK